MEKSKMLMMYGHHPKVKVLEKTLGKKNVRTILLEGLSCSAMPMALASMVHKPAQKNTSNMAARTILFVLPDADQAGYVYHDLTQLLDEGVLFFPSGYKRSAKYGQKDPANEILRTEVLSVLTSDTGGTSLIVTHPSALAELVVSKKVVDDNRIELNVGQEVSINDVVSRLIALGFDRQDYVYEPGQFALRGSILDIYSYSSELPLRLDFFGDEIDTIRTFEVADQLSKERRDIAIIVPELKESEEERQPLTAFLSDDAIVITKDIEDIVAQVEQIYRDGFSSQALEEKLAEATEVEREDIIRQMKKESMLMQPSVMHDELRRLRIIEYDNLQHKSADAVINFDITPQPLFHKNFDLLCQTLIDYQSKGYAITILADSLKQVNRLKDIIKSTVMSDAGVTLDAVVKSKTEGMTLHEGFVDNDLRACFFTDHQIFDRYHKYNLKSDKARSGKMALTLKELQEMEVGDYVVHVDFGIGRFMGLVRVPNGDTYHEVIRLQYQKGDLVDVSIHSLYKISKYRNASSGEEPRLSILGSGAWERLKEKTKKRIKDIARDLIRLYAKRRKEKGYAYSPDSYLQNELEASFLYEDTPDQERATIEVKRDMEKAAPMDRLVCGDVGFGKTEVAIRAAFKAACDSKQVAVLVPTTVLAFQHYRTFSSRLEGLPVRVEYLSRARSAKATKAILADLADGKVDILIGTHKLIGKTVKWKDLRLLIIDEEQKFGVSTKEKLRQLKTNVDTLTMSATPIPRTLQFSLMGARDMSIMRTPPPNRHPITTQLASFGHEVICDAIEFEMSRNGQVYFVNPRISNLMDIKLLIEKHLPDCRVVIGHGQMSPEELEKILVGFMNYDFDVLLSTTIVENGIDIPNANTIIINDAHKFGLSDLHQMRGRVGRSNKKAFCFLLSPPLSLLNNNARTRLEAMGTFSDLGSGFALAMQDLDIRGAGNLLGAEQSGFMEDLGYETYQKILKQAMAELRNEEPEANAAEGDEHNEEGKKHTEEANKRHTLQHQEREEHAGEMADSSIYVDDCSIESDLEMYFPELYVPGSAERMLLYRELNNIEDDADLESYKKRLEDRFGPVPHEGLELMNVSLLRRKGRELGCVKIVMRKGIMQLHLVENTNSPYYHSQAFGMIINYVTGNPRICQLKEVGGKPRVVVGNVASVGDALGILNKIIASTQ